MIFSNQLGAKQILRAAQWYRDHKTHVDELIKTVSIAYPPYSYKKNHDENT